MAMLIQPDGAQVDFVLPVRGPAAQRLAVVQDALGGFVEAVAGPAQGTFALVDEDGMSKQLPLNMKASVLLGKRVLGPAVVCSAQELLDWDGDAP